MPVYDFSSGFNALNSGIKSLGDSLRQADQSAYQQQVGALLAQGDYDGAANLAYRHGDIDTGQKLANAKMERDALKDAPTGGGGAFGNATTGGGTAPVGSGIGPQASAAPASSGGISPLAPKAAQYFMGNGVTNPLGAAALAAGFQAESGYNPGAVAKGDGRDGSDAVNVGQWNGSRAVDFRNFYQANKLNPSDPATGLAFAKYELTYGNEKDKLAALNAARTPEEAQAAAISYFRPKGWTSADPTAADDYQRRVGMTKAVYASLGNAGGGAVTASAMPPIGATGGTPASALVWRATDGTTYGGPNGQIDAGAGAVLVGGAAPSIPASAGGVPGGYQDTPTNRFIASKIGPAATQKLLTSPPNTPLSQILDPSNISPATARLTVKQFYDQATIASGAGQAAPAAASPPIQAASAGAAVPGGTQTAPEGMTVPQFAMSGATPSQQITPEIGSGLTALQTPSNVSPVASDTIGPIPGAVAPPVAAPPMRLASTGGVPAPDTGVPGPQALPPGPAASAVPQATIDKFQADNPGTVGDEIKRPDGSFELNEPDDAAQAWATKNAAKYGLVQDPADPTHFMAASGGGGAAAASGGGGTAPPSPRAVAISQTPADPNPTPEKAKASVVQLLRDLPPGDQRRIDFLEGQQMKYARLSMLGIKGAEAVANVYGGYLAKEREAAAPSASLKEYHEYVADQQARHKSFLSLDDWKNRPKEVTTFRAATADDLTAHGLDPSRVNEFQVDSAGRLWDNPKGSDAQGDNAKFAARRKQIAALGIDPNDPRAQQYILTGGMADPNKFSVAEQKLISETDDKNVKLTQAVSALQKAKTLIPIVHSGMFAGARTFIDRNDPIGILGNAKVGAATTEYDNLVYSTALGVLKDIYGGKVTNYEDQQFYKLQPNSGASLDEKQVVLDDLINRYTSQQHAAQSKLEELQGKRFYGAKGPGGTDRPEQSTPKGPNPAVPLQGAPGGPPPAAAPPSTGGISEGATATNPKTGQKIIFKGGQWQAL